MSLFRGHFTGRTFERNRMFKIMFIVTVLLILIFLLPRLLSGSRPGALKAGSAAPDFSLPSQEDASISLKDYRGKWVVLYFYPKDQTHGCTLEARNFQIDQPKYRERNAVVLGVSVDSVDSHKKFCAKEGLNFKLLSDYDGAVSKQYGSLTDLLVVKMASRHTFLIDPGGNVAKSYTTVDWSHHSEEILAALDQFRQPSRPREN